MISDEVLARRMDILDALEHLGDGLNAWYVDKETLCRWVGITRGQASRHLAALERAELAESNFRTPKSYRIRRRGEDLLATIREVVRLTTSYQSLIENLVAGYISGAMGDA